MRSSWKRAGDQLVAKQTEQVKSQVVAISGVNESLDLANPSAVAVAGGVFPFFYGSVQRHFGKKLIDFNPGCKVSAIHQVFSGVCVYGYYVETDLKLYYHPCSAPPDLRIKFAMLQ